MARNIKASMDYVDRIVTQALRKAGLSPTEGRTGGSQIQGGMLLSPEEIAELEEIQITRDAQRWAKENK